MEKPKEMYRKLNGYNWTKDYNDVFNYVQTNKIPEWIKTDNQLKKFKEKYRLFIIKDGKLYYEPFNLLVIPDDKKKETLAEFYKDLLNAGIGITSFYKKASQCFINIKRKDCEDFLKGQFYYQLTKPITHKTNKPLLPTKCNELWAIDLIDMNPYVSQNNGFRYILTCIDYFSRYVFARPLKNKTSEDVSNAMSDIFEEVNVYPERIQSDNGGEFSGELDELCDEHDIKHIRTTSYTPQSNGMIEGFNKIVRDILREIFIRNNNLKWVQYLPIVCENRNTTFVSSIKARPIDVYKPNIGTRFKATLNKRIVRLVKKNIENEIKKNKSEELKKGDYVRIQTSALYSEVRKMIKEGNKKNVVVSYTPNIYKIKTVYHYDPKYSKNEYTVESLDGNVVNKRLFASQMQKVDYKPTMAFPQVDLHKLNRIPKDIPIMEQNRMQTRVNYEPDYWQNPY